MLPGNANLPIGGLHDARRGGEIGVPGSHQKLDWTGSRTYSSSQRRGIIFLGDISEIVHSHAAPEPDDKNWRGKTDEASGCFACEANPR